MTNASEWRSGKGHRDENFPVASWIIHPRHRALILAFYNFVRTADDIADHATLGGDEKLALLDLLEAELLGKGDSQMEAVNLRRALAERAMPPRHALDVLIAFRMDVTKLRYETWDEVIHYCRYSAMPVGRFMLDVHGENTSTWVASDALCAGLQINNHLQDCGKDFRNLNRVYLPRDALAASGASAEQLGEAQAAPALLQCLQSLAARNEVLLDESKSLAAEVRDFRLGLEIAVIQSFADKIVRLLKVRDPLRERVHLNPIELLAFSIGGLAAEIGPASLRAPPDIEIGGRRMTGEVAAASPNYGTTASGSSFYAAMRILPQRTARRRCFRSTASAARSTISRIPTDHAISGWRRCNSGAKISTRSIRAIRRRGCAITLPRSKSSDLKREDFLAIVDGMEMDVPQDIRAPDLATLDLYCDRVASAVGRLSVKVFGLAERRRRPARASSRPRVAVDQHSARHRRRRRDRKAVFAEARDWRRPASARPIRWSLPPIRPCRRSARRWWSGPETTSRKPIRSWPAIRAVRCARRASCRSITVPFWHCLLRGGSLTRERRFA